MSQNLFFAAMHALKLAERAPAREHADAKHHRSTQVMSWGLKAGLATATRTRSGCTKQRTLQDEISLRRQGERANEHRFHIVSVVDETALAKLMGHMYHRTSSLQRCMQ